MIFVKQERLLRISRGVVVAVHIYVQERNVAWFTDSVLQEVLQGIRPRIADKVAECKAGTVAASVFANRAVQAAYYVDRADSGLRVLLQERAVKPEGGRQGESEDDASQFEYTALRAARQVLVLVPEPYDPNNTVALPEILGVDHSGGGGSGGQLVGRRWAGDGIGVRRHHHPRLEQAARALEGCVDTRDIGAAWRAFVELKDLELALGRSEVADELHRRLPAQTLHRILRAVLPDFATAGEQQQQCGDGAARHVYMYTKLLNYLLQVSMLRKGERNEVAVLRLAMGQCVRRLVGERHTRTAQDARALVGVWARMSETSSRALQLNTFDVYMLVHGAWKGGRQLLVPYLYRLGCQRWRVGEEAHFQKLSALVLSFYVREHAAAVGAAVVRGLLVDLNRRLVRLSPTHYSMLILYFGRTGNLDEVVRVFEQAMDDPEAAAAEATYYNTLRAFGSAFEQQSRRGTGVDVDVDAGVDMNAIPTDADAIPADTDAIPVDTDPAPADRLQAAKTCMWIFQRMASSSSGVRIGARTYRELAYCMVRLGMRDKAQRVFEFALESLESSEVTARFVAFYLRLVADTPQRRQAALRGLLAADSGGGRLAAALGGFSRRTLATQFGVFGGDLGAFVAGARRAGRGAGARGGEFLRRFVGDHVHGGRRAARFVASVLAGSDAGGRFRGYSFPTLGAAAGVAGVEAEAAEAWRRLAAARAGLLRHRDVVHAVLPAVAGGAAHGEREPDGVRRIRDVAGGWRDVADLVARLDAARIEGYDIGLINHFLRVRFLGLTFRRYAREKAAGRRVFWPAFMYALSNGPLVLGDASPLATATRAAYAREVAAAAHAHAAAAASWAQLAAAAERDPRGRLSPDANTLAIFSCVAGYAEDWDLGRRVWADAFRLLGRRGGRPGEQDDDDDDDDDDDGASPPPPAPAAAAPAAAALPLERVRPYKCYLQLAAQATLARAGARGLGFGEDALVDVLALMARNGVDVTPGLLCQAVAAAFRLGQIDVAAALEEWQLLRERRGLAPPGFLRRYFAARGAPEPPPELTSVLGLVRGAPAGCPRLVRLIAQRTQRAP
ncbi:hypothetical protein H4R18_004497 [Coemansia javaensis]|uniref:Uncharacterized protein n=1 Tax=Coemansia javaensis TaxID=2761396 RepID=A0A9W8LGU0_9FUNG|nr:hypothetical protein H4R18_004497 [Coemansia javaensis]